MLHFDRMRVFRYLDRCQTPEKGYCHFLDRQSGAGFPNVADTYWALASFRLLKSDPPALPETRQWLRRQLDQDRTWHCSPYLFWALGSLHLCGEPLSLNDKSLMLKETERLLGDRVPDFEVPSLLQDIGATLSLRRYVGLPLTDSERELLGSLLRQEASIPGAMPLPDLQNRIFLDGLSKGRQEEADLRQEAVYRHVVFGYSLVPGTSRSDLFVLRSGLLMRRTPLSLQEADRLNNLIVLCQSREGGFGPVEGAIPGLDATCAALHLGLVLLPLAVSAREGQEMEVSSGVAEIDSW